MKTEMQYVYLPAGMVDGPAIKVEFRTVADDGKRTMFSIPLSKPEVKTLIGLLQRSLTGC